MFSMATKLLTGQALCTMKDALLPLACATDLAHRQNSDVVPECLLSGSPCAPAAAARAWCGLDELVRGQIVGARYET